MGAKNFAMLKKCIDSTSIVHGNMLWALASLWAFFCNHVLSSLVFMLRYLFRFEIEERKIEHAGETRKNESEDYEIDEFAEKLVNLMFPSGEEREDETECSVSVEATTFVSDVHSDKKSAETDEQCSALKEKDPETGGVCEESEGEKEGYDSAEAEAVSYVDGDVKKISESETEYSVSKVHEYGDSVTSTTTSKYEFMARRDISVFVQEPTVLTFSFREFYGDPTASALSSVDAFAQEQEQEEYFQEQITSSTSDSLLDDSLQGSEETLVEDNLDEPDLEEDYDEEDDDLDWEEDDDEDEEEDDDEEDELLQQLKMEMRIAKQGGLATILEEEEEEEKPEKTESPSKAIEDLKPLRIEDKKVEYKDHILQIQKVYKSYAEKMRKLDVLNDQTMHAIGLLQLKDPPKLFIMAKSTVKGGKALVSQNLWPRKAEKQTSDPMLKFVQELHRDLELVYVGQVCLTWEILCWQHNKAKELQQHDSPWPHSYNLVAGEFQLFQVLVERFLENEPFQGPRIQNYVKNRCVVRNLLHVPAIKDDNRKDKKITKWGEEEDAIASGKLLEIIKESMQVFWEFVRADKDYENVIPKVSKKRIGNDVSDPEISDLLVDIRAQLQKKEKKLKDIVRSASCIVRKFQKHKNEDQIQVDHEQFLAQMGLRLISRVVNMKRLRKDQLEWCSEKLNRIKFVGTKTQVEPYFLLFPC
ncbi:hypothetical protein Ahy_B03g062562 [Arachis hypogaea]|uniref:Ribosomal protein L34Ae n=1 Tax=Arachis hypogaea TaxID=3818 RepID=A0A444ZUL0_ARAHY|nr:hypothetical protein Ahy_B03g062562 [Arachis hypogaea]